MRAWAELAALPRVSRLAARALAGAPRAVGDRSRDDLPRPRERHALWAIARATIFRGRVGASP